MSFHIGLLDYIYAGIGRAKIGCISQLPGNFKTQPNSSDRLLGNPWQH
jgi:hypothetical protein